MSKRSKLSKESLSCTWQRFWQGFEPSDGHTEREVLLNENIEA